jgi:HEAT repeat protein
MLRRALIVALVAPLMACNARRPKDPEWLLQNGSPEEKQEYLREVGYSGDAAQAREIARFLQDRDSKVVAQAAFFIGYLKARDFIPQLRNLLGHTDDGVVNMAAAGLREMIDQRDIVLTADLERLLTHRYLLARIGGIEGLGKLGSKQSIALLIDRFEHDEPAAKYYAAISLGQIKDPAALPALEHALAAVKKMDHSSPHKGRARGTPPHPDLMQDALESAIASIRT